MKLLAGHWMYPEPCPTKRSPAAKRIIPMSVSGVCISLSKAHGAEVLHAPYEFPPPYSIDSSYGMRCSLENHASKKMIISRRRGSGARSIGRPAYCSSTNGWGKDRRPRIGALRAGRTAGRASLRRQTLVPPWCAPKSSWARARRRLPGCGRSAAIFCKPTAALRASASLGRSDRLPLSISVNSATMRQSPPFKWSRTAFCCLDETGAAARQEYDRLGNLLRRGRTPKSKSGANVGSRLQLPRLVRFVSYFVSPGDETFPMMSR
jgi:hypothetical protein